MIDIAHLTSVHPRYDTRIFIKQCQSLANNDYKVSLIVADGHGDEVNKLVHIYDVGRPISRIKRMLGTTKKVYQKALELDAKIYHIHDPELLPIGLKLLKKNKKVIFDAHEDVPKQILSKPYLTDWQAKLLALLFENFEKKVLPKFSGVVAATPHIALKFNKVNNRVVDINNYPCLGEFSEGKKRNIVDNSDSLVCYVGGISKVRGIKEIVESMKYVKSNAKLAIAGSFSELDFENEIKSLPLWKGVQELGFLNREEVKHILFAADVGLVTLYPTVNYLESLPVKMFEYMAASLPVIASNFDLWEEIIEKNKCGICVNPMSPKEIAKAIDYLINNPTIAKNMGENGRRLVHEKYNWVIEEKKLLALYNQVLS